MPDSTEKFPALRNCLLKIPYFGRCKPVRTILSVTPSPSTSLIKMALKRSYGLLRPFFNITSKKEPQSYGEFGLSER